MAKKKSTRKKSGRKSAAYKTKQILKPGFDMPESRTELLKIYKTIAKTADTRIRRLEQYSSEPGYKDATRWAYAKAKYMIKEWSGPEAEFFDTKAPSSTQQLQQKIADIMAFLNAPSSTKSGIKSIHQKRAATINKDYGTKFTWQDTATFFESSLRDDMEERYGSKTMVRIIGRIQKQKDDVIKAIQKSNLQDIKTSKNDMVDQLMLDTVKSYGPDIEKLLNGNAKRRP